MIALVDYGAGNLRSVEFALDRLGVAHRRAPTPDELGDARGIVLPGVGAAASAMAELTARGWPDAFKRRERPLLGICLGMQLLCETSEEGGVPTACLGLIPGSVRRFGWDAPGAAARRPVPHAGWNRVTARSDDALFQNAAADEYFYFLHSYRADCPDDVVSATATYGEPFPAAVRSGGVAGVQFHPEKSGSAGTLVLRGFCRECGAC
ncbi:MAG TPA: imidazole glycerol phosphate synthase subunit HisH [Gemmatimonadota bacterium]|nr:imidazole glycerol phosphate synthase subunit HisH [Gemmatimonadota bacterium]